MPGDQESGELLILDRMLLYTLADRGKYRSDKPATPAGVVFVFIALARAVSRMPEPGTITRWHPASAAVCD